MPLHPASIETAKPFTVLRRTLPAAATLGSNSVTSHALIAASASVHGTTKYRCAPRRQLGGEERHLQRDERDEETEHRPILPNQAEDAPLHPDAMPDPP
jgi:hypothetical protein